MRLKLLLMLYWCFHIVIGQGQANIKVSNASLNCYNNTTFNYVSTVSGRYTYAETTTGFSTQIRWDASQSRWEIILPDGTELYSNTSTLSPSPPTSGWTVLSGCDALTVFVILPVELTQFDVQNTEGSKNNLTWRTASEKNNSHFDIERSTDGTTFHSIGQVKGNNKPSSYQFTDATPPLGAGGLYYRLRQIDFDGTETFSKIVSVQLKGKGKGLTIYPTLVSNVLTVEYTDGTSRDNREGSLFQVINLLGQQVLVGKTTTQIDVSALAKGTYILKVGTEVAKFVKQ